MNEPDSVLSNRLRALRVDVLHWTQEQMAVALRVSVMSISSWEKGYAQPRTSTLRKYHELTDRILAGSG